MRRSNWLVVWQSCFIQNGDEFIGEHLAIRAVDTYSVLIHQFAAEVSCIGHDRIPESAGNTAARTGPLSSQKQRRYKQRGAT